MSKFIKILNNALFLLRFLQVICICSGIRKQPLPYQSHSKIAQNGVLISMLISL